MESVKDLEHADDWKKQAFDSISKGVCEDNGALLGETLHVIIDNSGRELESVITNRDANGARSLLHLLKDVLVHLHLRQSSLTRGSGFRYWDFVSALLSVTLDLKLLLAHLNGSRKELRRAVLDLCFHLNPNRHQVWDAIVQGRSMKRKALTQYLPEVIEKLLTWCPSSCNDPSQYLKFVVTVASVSRCKKVDEEQKVMLKKALSVFETSFDFHEWFFSQSFCDVVPPTCSSQKKLVRFLFGGEITRHQLHSLCHSVSTISTTNADLWRDDDDVFFIDKRPVCAEDVSEGHNELEGSLKSLEAPGAGCHVAADDIVDPETISSSSDLAEDPVTFLESYLSSLPNTAESTKDASSHDDHVCELSTKEASEMPNTDTPEKKKSRGRSAGSDACERSRRKRPKNLNSDEAVNTQKDNTVKLGTSEHVGTKKSASPDEIQLSPTKLDVESVAPVQPQTSETGVPECDTSSTETQGKNGSHREEAGSQIKVEHVHLDEGISDTDTIAHSEDEVPEDELPTTEMALIVDDAAAQPSPGGRGTAEVLLDEASCETELHRRSDEPDATVGTPNKTRERKQKDLPVLAVRGEPHENAEIEVDRVLEVVEERASDLSVVPSEPVASREITAGSKEVNCKGDTPHSLALPKAERLSLTRRTARLAMQEALDESNSRESAESHGGSTGSETAEKKRHDTPESPCRVPPDGIRERGDAKKRKTASEPDDTAPRDAWTQTPSPANGKPSSSRQERGTGRDANHAAADDSDPDALLLDVDGHNILKLKPSPLSPDNATGTSLYTSPDRSVSQVSTQLCAEDKNCALLASSGTSCTGPASIGDRMSRRSTDPTENEDHVSGEPMAVTSHVEGRELDESLSGLTQICAILCDAAEGRAKLSPRAESQREPTPPTNPRVRSARRSAATARKKIAEYTGAHRRPLGDASPAFKTSCSGQKPPSTADGRSAERATERPQLVGNGMPEASNGSTDNESSAKEGANEKTEKGTGPQRKESSHRSEKSNVDGRSDTAEAPVPCKIARISLGRIEDLLCLAGMTSTPRTGTPTKQTPRSIGARSEMCATPVNRSAHSLNTSSHRLSASFCTSCFSVVEVTPTSDVATMTESPVISRERSNHSSGKHSSAKKNSARAERGSTATPRVTRQREVSKLSTETGSARYNLRRRANEKVC